MTAPEFKFREIYRVPSNRLKGYDYSSEGAYFITICTKNRENYFGNIENGSMMLNEMGEIVQNQILNMEKHFKYVIIDAFVVMPNHIHLIIVLEHRDVSCRDVSCRDVSEKHLYDESNKFTKQYYSTISPKKWTIGNIIKLFKWFTNKKINALWKDIYFNTSGLKPLLLSSKAPKGQQKRWNESTNIGFKPRWL